MMRHFAHVFIAANEHPEVGGLAGVGADCPTCPHLMKDLAVADQAINMGFGEKIGRGEKAAREAHQRADTRKIRRK